LHRRHRLPSTAGLGLITYNATGLLPMDQGYQQCADHQWLGIKKFIKEHSHDILEIFEDRHRLRFTLITCQVPIDHWYEIFSDPAHIGRCHPGRLIHNAYRIKLKGESTQNKKTSLTQKQ
jgi:hypothetical protein